MNYIHDWLDREFGKVVPVSSGRELRIDCPFCGDHKQHLYVSTVEPIAHCFRCEWGGTHFELIQEVSGAESIAEVWAIIKRRPSVKFFESVADRLARKTETLTTQLNTPDWFRPFKEGLNGRHSELVLGYALKRLDWEDIARYGLGYSTNPNGNYAFRLIIPVERGYWQARAIYKSDKKYLSPDSPKQDRLFNYPALDWADPLHVCEGAISAMAIGVEAVATLAKAATPEQMRRIAESKAGTVIIAYDADSIYHKGALDLAQYLYSCDKRVIMRHYKFGDPDSCDMWEDIPYDVAYQTRARLFLKQVY